jgi:hypothetical protein
MKQEEIIRMAREAEFDSHGHIIANQLALLERFAALVAAASAAAENEACAKVCETLGVHPAVNVWNGGPDWYKHGKDCAAEIRARGNT